MSLLYYAGHGIRLPGLNDGPRRQRYIVVEDLSQMSSVVCQPLSLSLSLIHTHAHTITHTRAVQNPKAG